MIKAVIFDVDGVLLDSFASNVEFFNGLLAEFGYRGPTAEDYKSMYHMPMWDVIKTMTGIKDDREVEKIWRRGQEPSARTRLVAKMPIDAQRVVQDLWAKYKLGVVSGRTRSGIFGEGLKNLQKYFSVAIGYEDTKNHKPHPEPLLLAAKLVGVMPTECIYIGDALTDVQAGNAAGMKTIVYGEKKLEGADALARSFTELSGVITGICKEK
ncbi:MAG: HAD family hydrolase [Candidatus Paceibacterota bacterium]|jgi:pyrophosphatase PpaX